MTDRRYALVVTSHRGDLYLPETLRIARKALPWDQLAVRIVIDDCGGATFDESDSEIAAFGTHERTGLSGVVGLAWSMVPAEVTHVFHLEEDFLLTEPVDLDAMADVIERDGLAQMALLRQPWSPSEIQQGGYQQSPLYEQRTEYLHHTQGFWLNPCLIPADVIRGGGGVESDLTARWAHRGFGVWGQRNDPPRCLHVGAEGGMGSVGWLP